MSLPKNDTLSVFNRDDQGLINSFYLQDQHIFANKLTLKAGVRAVHYSVSNKLYLEPRASLSYALSNTWKLKAAWGQYNQFATRIVREDIQQGSRDFGC